MTNAIRFIQPCPPGSKVNAVQSCLTSRGRWRLERTELVQGQAWTWIPQALPTAASHTQHHTHTHTHTQLLSMSVHQAHTRGRANAEARPLLSFADVAPVCNPCSSALLEHGRWVRCHDPVTLSHGWYSWSWTPFPMEKPLASSLKYHPISFPGVVNNCQIQCAGVAVCLSLLGSNRLVPCVFIYLFFYVCLFINATLKQGMHYHLHLWKVILIREDVFI